MITDTRFQVVAESDASSDATVYFATPYRCVLRDVRAIPQAEMSCSSASTAVTVTASISSSSTALGTVEFTLDSSKKAAVGVPGTYTPDASTGSTVLAANQVISLVADDIDNNLLLDIVLDPHARSL